MRSHINTIFMFALLILVGIGVYFVFKPFLIPIIVAFIISQLFKNWYTKVLKKMKGRKAAASGVMLLIVFLVIFIPLVIASSLIISEATDVFEAIQRNNIKEKIVTFVGGLPLEKIGIDLPSQEESANSAEQAQKITKAFGEFALTIVKSTYQGVSTAFFMSFVMFFALYYFFKDNTKIIKTMMNLSPLRNVQEKMLLDKFVAISRATLKGTLVIALIQGIIMAITFWIAGVPSASLWGLLTVIISMIPVIGPPIVWIPVAVITLIMGNIWQAILIAAVGAGIVGTIDNFLRPKLVGNDTSLHPLLVFLSTIGGLAVFGISGFILGPIVVVLFITLLDIYKTEYRADLQKFNK